MTTKRSTTKVSKTTPKLTESSTKNYVYVPVSNNIYYNGKSYRVRVTKDGQRFDEYLSSKKKAFELRKKLLSA
jgi:hypothetical protein